MLRAYASSNLLTSWSKESAPRSFCWRSAALGGWSGIEHAGGPVVWRCKNTALVDKNSLKLYNEHLQNELGPTRWANGLEGRKLSGRISRHLRLLREHGLIKKLPKQHKYILTAKGRALTTALNQFMGANVSDLSKLAAWSFPYLNWTSDFWLLTSDS